MRIKKIFELTKTLLKSTSIFNQLKHLKDNKKRKRLIMNLFAYVIVFIYMFVLTFFMGYEYIELGLGSYIPSLSIVAVSSLTFILTFFKADSYLINFKSRETLLSLPFSLKEVVISRFLMMYISSLSLQMDFVLGYMAAYIWFLRPSVLFVIGWLLLSIIIPLIPTAISSLIGMFIGRVTVKFRFKKLMRLLFSILVLSATMFSSFFLEYFMHDTEIADVMSSIAIKVNSFKDFYAPAKWMENILFHGDILSFVAVIVITVLALCIFVSFTASAFMKLSFSGINKNIKNKKHLQFRKRSVEKTIAYKEFKRFMGSTNYILNAGFGLIIVLILSILSLSIGGDKIIYMFTDGLTLEKDLVIPLIPFAVYLFSGMVSTTCISPSLEGKNFWIVQSLPVSKKKLYLGKMLFNLELMLPASLVSCLLLDISFNATLFETIISLLLETILVFFSTLFGLILGDKLIKLEFDNEIEVIKQSAAVFVYMFSNMILTIIMIAVSLNFILSSEFIYVLYIPFAVYSVLCTLCYMVIKRFCW